MKGKALQAWTAIDHFIRTRPDEYCDVPPPGESLSDRVFMLQQAERIVKSPRISREDRATIERVWLSEAAEDRPPLRLVAAR